MTTASIYPTSEFSAATLQALLLGTGATGKTILKTAIEYRVLGIDVGGYHIDAPSIEEANEIGDGLGRLIPAIQEGTLQHTQGFHTLNLKLCHGRHRLASIRIVDMEGQIPEVTRVSSDEAQKKKMAELRSLGRESDVILVVLPIPLGRQDTARELFEKRLRDTLRVLRNFLELRESRHLEIKVLHTKIDGGFGSEKEARAALNLDTCRELVRPLFNLAQQYSEICSAEIWPISSWGFGNSVLDHTPLPPAGPGFLEAAEPIFALRKDRTMQPFNLIPMLLSAFRSGLMLQKVPVDVCPAESELLHHIESVGRLVDEGWRIPIKNWKRFDRS